MSVPRLARRHGALAILAGCILGVGFSLRLLGGQPAPPLDQARVGDWLRFKITGKAGVTIGLKQTLVAKDETTATLKNDEIVKFDQVAGETVLPATQTKLSLRQLRDPIKLADKLEHARIEKIKTGKEAIEVKGERIACEWTKFKVSYSAEGKDIESTSKIWTSTDIPVTGMVKLEIEHAGVTTTSTQLVDYGRGK